MSKLVTKRTPQAPACGICLDLSHTTDACPTLHVEDVNVLGGSLANPKESLTHFQTLIMRVGDSTPILDMTKVTLGHLMSPLPLNNNPLALLWRIW